MEESSSNLSVRSLVFELALSTSLVFQPKTQMSWQPTVVKVEATATVSRQVGSKSLDNVYKELPTPRGITTIENRTRGCQGRQ
jgi:hypothetical protein